jgi:hypothetical protein
VGADAEDEGGRVVHAEHKLALDRLIRRRSQARRMAEQKDPLERRRAVRELVRRVLEQKHRVRRMRTEDHEEIEEARSAMRIAAVSNALVQRQARRRIQVHRGVQPAAPILRKLPPDSLQHLNAL